MQDGSTASNTHEAVPNPDLGAFHHAGTDFLDECRGHVAELQFHLKDVYEQKTQGEMQDDETALLSGHSQYRKFRAIMAT